ncbi:MAG: acyltransferase [Bacteroidetes bacterium]|nr:acyltransferase [Bacteroidota bacterium]
MNPRLKELDGIRGVAILLILVWHYGNNLLYNNNSTTAKYFKMLTSYTWSGVDLFFTLSGFLLGGILLKQKKSTNYFKTFYTRRILRIFPIYFLTLSITFLLINKLIPYSHSWLSEGMIPNWSYFTFTQNIFMGLNETLGNRWVSHTWSLGLEEQFYIILPILIYFLPNRLLVIILLLGCIAAPLFRYYSNNWYESFNYLHCRLDALFSGVLASILCKQTTVTNYIKSKTKWADGILIVWLLLTLMLSCNKIQIHYVLENTWFSGLFLFTVLVICNCKESIFYKIIVNPILTKLGIISYGVYLYHPLVLGVLHYLFLHQSPILMSSLDLYITILSLIMTIVVATISYHFIEKPLIKLGHSYAY